MTITKDMIDRELSRCTGMLGEINEDCRIRLIQVLKNPCQGTWEDAHSIILNGVDTLWQSVLQVAPDFPKSKPHEDDWQRIPTQNELLNAIRWATH